jgi:spore coat protein U-like protein
MEFGTYDPVNGSAKPATNQIKVTCTNGAVFDVGLNGGVNGTIAQRKLKFGTDTLNYNIYKEVGHSNVWGDTVGTDTEQETSLGAPIDLTAFGQIPASQIAGTSAGTYQDTITVTVTY